MDKRDRAALFRTRLQEAMARDGLNRSSLARAVSADRSTIGQLLQAGEARLPSGALLADLAAVLRVSCDWLLGLSDHPERPGDLLDAAMAMTGAERSVADDQIMAWHREARGFKIRHVPATLPDMLKTEAVLRWEYDTQMGKTPDQAVRIASEFLTWAEETGSDYEIALPEHELRSLASGTGYYSGLAPGLRRDLLTHMADRCDTLYPSLRVYLFDARRVFSAPMTIFGPGLAVIYVGRFYLAFRERDRMRSLTRHFDWLVREAVVEAHGFAAVARKMSAEI
ncbi:transcriptional regulator [Fluviibacterium sp. DFM31]|uniref:Transcriptional regulator n=1 Tax=Meridianimarinicoccus marinus TaxID=3231483 RepID=A0ABV3L0W4_9RHOB